MEYLFICLYKLAQMAIVAIAMYNLGFLRGRFLTVQKKVEKTQKEMDFIVRNYNVEYLATNAYSTTELQEYFISPNVNYTIN